MTPQQQAQQWLRENCLILDTETTGLGEDAEIVEVTIIDTAGRVLLNTLVKPRSVIPAEATAIHGITNEMVRRAPTWPEVSLLMHRVICDETIAVYNASYDIRLFSQTDAIWGISPTLKPSDIRKFVCAMRTYAEFYGQKSERGGYKWQKLTSAAEQQGVIIEGTPHRALSDCLTTLGVIKAMAAGGYHSASHGITAQKAVDILNGLLQVDHAAITALVNQRVFCSEKLAKETSVDFYDGYYLIGMMGIINALVAPDSIGAIYADMVLIGFEIVDSSVEGGDL
ncbi:3'-5' exonuclease [Serratia sp. IR-2025]